MLRSLTFAAAILFAGTALAAPLPPTRDLPPKKCWNCEQTIPRGSPNCPYCGSPRDKPKYRDYYRGYETRRDYYRY